MDKLKNFYLVQAWLVLFISCLFGAALAGLQSNLAPKIEENKVNESKQKVPELLLSAEELESLKVSGETLDIEPNLIKVDKGDKVNIYNTYTAKDKDGKLLGTVVKTKGAGYADKIEILIGLDAKMENIKGLFILDQKETPGLGNKISTIKWRGQFINKPIDKELIVVKTGAQNSNEIDAVSGATISSKSVCSIINKAVLDLKTQSKN